MRAKLAPRLTTATVLALATLACRGLQKVASTAEVGYGVSGGSLDGVHGRSQFDSDAQIAWLSVQPLAFLEPPTKTVADPRMLAALERLSPPPPPPPKPETQPDPAGTTTAIVAGILAILSALGIGGTKRGRSTVKNIARRVGRKGTA